jgi:phage major head subunit gpT-like protein
MGQYSNAAGLDSKDIVADFYPVFEQNFAGSWARSLAWINPDTVHETEQYRWLGAAPQMRQWVGGRQEQGFNKNTMTLTNVKYETTIPIYLDDLRRDKTGQIRVRVEDAAAEAGRHDEELVTTLITGNSACYDTQNFYSASHTDVGSGTAAQTNLLSLTQVPAADVVAPTAPTAAEMALVLLQTIGYMYGYTNDKGKAVNGTAREFTIMVGTAALYGSLVQAINLNNLSNTGVLNNPLKAFNTAAGDPLKLTAIFNPSLSSRTTRLNVFRTDGKLRPFVLQYETPLMSQLLGAGSDEEFNNDRHVFGLKWVKAAGYGMWYHSADVTLS